MEQTVAPASDLREHPALEPLPAKTFCEFLAVSFGRGGPWEAGSTGGPEVPAVQVQRRVEKRRWDWRGERLFESVTVPTPAGDPLKLFLKYRRPSPDPGAPVTPLEREARVYRDLLAGAALGTARFHGAATMETDGTALLLLEHLEGQQLKKVSAQETWQDVARWLARLHRHFSLRRAELEACVFLERQDTDFYRQWARRAAESVLGASARAFSSIAISRMEQVLSAYGKVAGLLGGAPPTLIHGEFYCTNVMVGREAEGPRICAFDWETAALGCGALDLTYLFRQKWGIDEESLIGSYLEGWREAGGPVPSSAELRAQILAARVHELLCRLWSRLHCGEARASKVERYTERAMGYIERL